MSHVETVKATVKLECYHCPSVAIIQVGNTEETYRTNTHFINEAVFRAGWEHFYDHVVCPKCWQALDEGES